MRADESISLEEAKDIYEKYLTEESKKLLKDSFDLSDVWDISIRKGVIYNDEGIPAALAGLCIFNLRNVLWLVPLEGMRNNVRRFIKFMRNMEFDGEVYTFADDPEAKFIKLAGGKKDISDLWKLKER